MKLLQEGRNCVTNNNLYFLTDFEDFVNLPTSVAIESEAHFLSDEGLTRFLFDGEKWQKIDESQKAIVVGTPTENVMALGTLADQTYYVVDGDVTTLTATVSFDDVKNRAIIGFSTLADTEEVTHTITVTLTGVSTFYGTDCDEGDFTPVAGKHYVITIADNGTSTFAIVK